MKEDLYSLYNSREKKIEAGKRGVHTRVDPYTPIEISKLTSNLSTLYRKAW